MESTFDFIKPIKLLAGSQAVADEELAAQKQAHLEKEKSQDRVIQRLMIDCNQRAGKILELEAKLEVASKSPTKPIVELTDDELDKIWNDKSLDTMQISRTIIAAHIAKQNAPPKIKARWYVNVTKEFCVAVESETNLSTLNPYYDLNCFWRSKIFELDFPK